MLPVSREKYNAVVAERDRLLTEMEELRSRINAFEDIDPEVISRANDLATALETVQSQLGQANVTIAGHLASLEAANSRISTLEGELQAANTRVEELEQTVVTLNGTAVEDTSRAITESDALDTDPMAFVDFFRQHADDTDACIHRLRELGL
jgi:chromosome segregation ATPase